jgi:hypothetical protein
MEQQKYEIGGKAFRFTLSLAQDEILAPIVRSMLTECPEALSSATRSMIDVSKAIPDGSAIPDDDRLRRLEDQMVTLAFDMAKVNAWVYEKHFARRILAVLLVPTDKEFDENDISEREEFMAKHATRDVVREVINTFFTRSGVLGLSTGASSPTPATTKAP